jgi:hypothetical protein
MDANPPATMVKEGTCETPMRRRSELLPVVLVFLLAACAEDAPAPRTPAPGASDPVQVRWLHVDTLLRGGVASLLPDGRASLDLMHLGGGTQWLGSTRPVDLGRSASRFRVPARIRISCCRPARVGVPASSREG